MAVTTSRKIAGWEAEARARLRVAAAEIHPGRWAFTAVANTHQLRLRVQYRPPASTGINTAQSANIPLVLIDDAESFDQVRKLVRRIAQLMNEGSSLRAALNNADAERHVTTGDWTQIAEQFHAWKTGAENSVKEGTWQKGFAPFVNAAVALLDSDKCPPTASNLVLQVAAAWPTGTRRRQQAVDALVQFLEFAVHECQAPSQWAEGLNRKRLKGRLPNEKRAEKNRQCTLTDPEIVALIESIKNEQGELSDSRRRWHSALQLVALCGLRPVELLHLKTRQRPDGTTGLWCTYSKRAGATGSTQPRWLEPYELETATGGRTNWWPGLVLQFRTGTWELPPIHTGNAPSDNLNTFLRRVKAWQELVGIYAPQGYKPTGYFARDAYARRLHELGFSTADAALFMGHSEATHTASYPFVDSRAATARADQKRKELSEVVDN